jgi:uncharacterized RDD family membrane protein YckC
VKVTPVSEPPAADRREVVSPEGVPLVFHLAEHGRRAAAFVQDLLLQLLVLMGLGLAAAFLGGSSPLVAALLELFFFFLRHFYFVWFETRWRGATPGKRRQGLRVVDASGGPLRPEAIFVRNVTRELEVFWPLGAWLRLRDSGVSEGPFLLVASLAVFLLGLLPLLNRDRRRLGDLIAGTMVVSVPRAILLEDLGMRRARARATSASELTFTAVQLEHYGVYELQVLEDVLRQRADREALLVVAEKIRARIGWAGPDAPARVFLQAFYKAQRAHLEQALLLGKARRSKSERE